MAYQNWCKNHVKMNWNQNLTDKSKAHGKKIYSVNVQFQHVCPAHH